MIDTSRKLIAQMQFVIDAPPQRVWSVLARAMYQCLPLEKVDIVDPRSFLAELKWNLAFVGLTFHLKGEFVELSPLSSVQCIISVRKWIILLGLRITFTLKALNQHRTEVVCVAVEEGTGGVLPRWVVRRPQQNFARNAFGRMRERLEQMCQ